MKYAVDLSLPKICYKMLFEQCAISGIYLSALINRIILVNTVSHKGFDT